MLKNRMWAIVGTFGLVVLMFRGLYQSLIGRFILGVGSQQTLRDESLLHIHVSNKKGNTQEVIAETKHVVLS